MFKQMELFVTYHCDRTIQTMANLNQEPTDRHALRHTLVPFAFVTEGGAASSNCSSLSVPLVFVLSLLSSSLLPTFL